VGLELPVHFTVPPAGGELVSDIEESEFRAFAEAISRVEHRFQFVVVDTPGSNSYLMRVSHAMADTLVTPINESFIDFDVLAHFDPVTMKSLGPSHYAALVAEARRQRLLVDSNDFDWVVVRNRLSAFETRNRKSVVRSLGEVSGELGFRIADGISERVVFREFFLRGLTALDPLDGRTLGAEPTMSHLAARREVAALIDSLKLPLGAVPPVDGTAPTRPDRPPVERSWPGSLFTLPPG
jgi:chromosome partitioning protein